MKSIKITSNYLRVGVAFIFLMMGYALNAQNVDYYFTPNNGWSVNEHLRTMGDVNGDGKDDIVGFGGGGVFVSFSDGADFLEPKLLITNFAIAAGQWDVNKHTRIVADVNGDGKADIVGFGGEAVLVSLSKGESFSDPVVWLDLYFSTNNGWNNKEHVRTAADVNGDGKADLIGFGGAGVFVSLSTGSSFAEPKLLVNNFAIGAGGWEVSKHIRLMVDINGDKKADIIGFKDDKVYVAFSNGQSFGNPRAVSFLPQAFQSEPEQVTSIQPNFPYFIESIGKSRPFSYMESSDNALVLRAFNKTSANQQFEFIPLEGGAYKIKNGNGLYFTYDSRPAYRKLSLEPIGSFGKQNFGVEFVKDGNVRISTTSEIGIPLYLKLKNDKIVAEGHFNDSGILFKIKSKISTHKTIAVNYIEKSDNGKIIKKFVQTGPRIWEEDYNKSWVELGRDEWSVYLKNENENIQLDLWQNKIYYWQNKDQDNHKAIFDISKSSNDVNGYMVTLVEYSSGGNKEKMGEFSRVSREYWKEITTTGKVYKFKQTSRDEWSIYLNDNTRGVSIRLDLHTKKIYYGIVNQVEKEQYDIISTYGMNEPNRKGIINFAGTNQSITVDGLSTLLEKEGGFKLVETTKVNENECALVFPSADMEDVSAQFGVLVCNARINDELSMVYQAVSGKCGASKWGAGIECEVNVGETELSFVEADGKVKKYKLTGPTAGACSSLSVDKLCASVGGSLVGVEFTDENGYGFGVSLDAGVGGGLGLDYSDGILSVDFELKLLVGGSVSLDVNLKEWVDNPVKAAEHFSKFSYLVSGGAIRVLADPLKSLAKDVFGEDAGTVINAGIDLVTECPFDVALWFFTMGQYDVDCLDEY